MKFVIELIDRLAQTNMTLVAAGVTFYGMLALFPGLSATIAIWSVFADPAAIRSYLKVASEFIPPEAFGILSSQIEALLNGPHDTLGWRALVSILIALWSARAGVAALVQGLNLIHGTRPRNTFLAYVFGYLMTVVLVGVMLAAFALVVIVPLAVNVLPFHRLSGWLTTGLPWIAMFVLMMTALGVLYRFGPNAKAGDRTAFISIGAVCASLIWGAVSIGLTYYLSNFGNYNRVYGSIGAVIALMMWLYVSAMSVLVGAALNAEIAEWRGLRSAASGTGAQTRPEGRDQ